MTQVNFYHLTKVPLERALPVLLEKTLESKARAVVVARDEQEVEELNNLLWTYRQNSFLPHGTVKDGYAEEQPIWLTSKLENPNNATIFVSIDGRYPEDMSTYDKILDLFDGHDHIAVEAARGRWREMKDKDIELSYFQQNDANGKWQKKSIVRQ